MSTTIRSLLVGVGAMVCIATTISFAGCGSDSATVAADTDSGAGDDSSTGMPDATTSTCGNSVVEHGEDCDDGNKVNGDGCNNDCTFTCTKGTVNGDSRCDDKEPCNGAETCTDMHTCAKGTPLADHASCGTNKLCRNGTCSDAVCGDGVVTAPEECDDGNITNGDGCDGTCKFSCVSTDTARNCMSNVCAGGGTCNDTTHVCAGGTPPPDGTSCGTNMICKMGVCGAPRCGDGIVTSPEQCDDGNQTPGDGCENNCHFSCSVPASDCAAAPVCNLAVCSTAHVCATSPNTAQNGQACGTNLVCNNGACVGAGTVCGNGVTETGEDCDFGSGNGAGTGCETNCKFSCTTNPNSCNDNNPCNGAETCGAVTVMGHAGQKCAAGTPLDNGVKAGTITTRIMWLDGLEPGFNRGTNGTANVDTHDREIYIHGTGDQNSLGKPASIGCIHLADANLIPLYDRLPIGTLVWISER